MSKAWLPLIAACLIAWSAASRAAAAGPEVIAIPNGPVTLHALLWRPAGKGPFPAVLLNHGSGRTAEELQRLGPYQDQAYVLAPAFLRRGYEFLYLFRRGVGLSQDQGENAELLMNREFAAGGQAARNRVQLQMLEGPEMSDAEAGLALLRRRAEVDPRRIAVIGHSFGGSLTVLQAEREPDLGAVVIFSGSGYSWDRSQELRARLLKAMERAKPPMFFIHAQNDYSLNPGRALDGRLAELGKPHRLKIYPPIGHTAEDGHNFLYLGVDEWEPDVFAFLDEQMGR